MQLVKKIDIFKQFDNYKKIHCDIVSRLKEKQYLTCSILDYKNKSFGLNQGPSYYYRYALSTVINELKNPINEFHPKYHLKNPRNLLYHGKQLRHSNK